MSSLPKKMASIPMSSKPAQTKTIFKTIASIRNADKSNIVEIIRFYPEKRHKRALTFKCTICGKTTPSGMSIYKCVSEPDGLALFEGLKYNVTGSVIFCENCMTGKYLDGFDQMGTPHFNLDTKGPLTIRSEEGL